MKSCDWKFTREYFEDGCLCVANRYILTDPEDPDEEAAKFYLRWCTCSRHPEYGMPHYQKEVPREV